MLSKKYRIDAGSALVNLFGTPLNSRHRLRMLRRQSLLLRATGQGMANRVRYIEAPLGGKLLKLLVLSRMKADVESLQTHVS